MTRSALTDGEDDDDASVVDEHGAGDMSTFKHTVLTIAIIVSGFAIAYFIDDLQMGKLPRSAMDSTRVNPTVRQYSPLLVLQDRRRFRSFYPACSSGS